MLKRLLITSIAALALAPSAFAKGGSYVFDGGTPAQQAQVKAAIDASSFDFSVVPVTVTIHIKRGLGTDATPGNINVDADLLDAGQFAWGVIQHEYGHQVDFFVLDDAARMQIQAALGGTSWCAGASHAQLTCERFADLMSWAYWTSKSNCMKPAGAADEGGQLSPAAFRALMAQLLPAPPVRNTTLAPPRKR